MELAKRYVTGSLKQKLRCPRNKLPLQLPTEWGMPNMGMGYYPQNNFMGNTPPMMMPPPNIQPPQIMNPPSYHPNQNKQKTGPPPKQ